MPRTREDDVVAHPVSAIAGNTAIHRVIGRCLSFRLPSNHFSDKLARTSLARRSASALTGCKATHRMVMMPGERRDQYRRNLIRAVASVATARVSVRNIENAGPTESARSVHAIFTKPGSSNFTNASGGSARKTTFASHGLVTAPTTTTRLGTIARTPHPMDVGYSRMPHGRVVRSGSLPSITSLALTIARASFDCIRSVSHAAANVTSAGAATPMW